MECREVREYLPAYVDQVGSQRHPEVKGHLEGCSMCRAELEQFRDISQSLAGLSNEAIEPPAWLESTITETIYDRAQRVAAAREKAKQLTDPRVIAGGAILVAGVAGAVLMRGRRRKRRSVARTLREALAET